MEYFSCISNKFRICIIERFSIISHPLFNFIKETEKNQSRLPTQFLP